MGPNVTPPLPPGFQLDQAPPLPPGFKLDGAPIQSAMPSAPMGPPKPKSLWETIKQAAKPDIFNAGDAGHELGGKVVDATGSPALGTAVNVASQAIPMLAGGIGGAAAVPLAKDAGRRVMQSAVKPTFEQLSSGEAAKGIETLLKQGYNPTKGGVDAMKARIADLGNEIRTEIAGSTATVNKHDVAARLEEALKKFEQQVNPKSDLKAIDSAWNEFLSHPLLTGKNSMPVQLAQEMKQGTYKQLGSKPYGELSAAAEEAQKQLARGLKEEISRAVPSVAPKNILQGELVNAKNIAERRALMQGNSNLLGMSPMATSPVGIAAMMADKSALIKSLLARGLYTGGEALPAAGAAAGAALGAQGTAPDPRREALLKALQEQQ